MEYKFLFEFTDTSTPFVFSIIYRKTIQSQDYQIDYSYVNNDNSNTQHLLYFEYIPENPDEETINFNDLYTSIINPDNYIVLDNSTTDLSGTIETSLEINTIYGFLIDSTEANPESTLQLEINIL